MNMFVHLLAAMLALFPSGAVFPSGALPTQPQSSRPPGLVSTSLLPRAPAGASWSWPVVPGVVIRQFESPPQPWLPGHRGVDLAARSGDAVLAAGAGVVVFAGMVAGRGVVSIDHADGLRTTYEPVAAVVRRGDVLDIGGLIGWLDPVGGHCGSMSSSGSCLHWGLRRGREYLDPLALLRTPRPRLLPVPPGWG